MRSLLRIKRLYDQVDDLARQLAHANQTLEQRVTEQVGQLERLGRLKRFFAAPLAELIVAGDADDPSRAIAARSPSRLPRPAWLHRLRRDGRARGGDGRPGEYHAEMGRLVLAHEGTLERFTGTG